MTTIPKATIEQALTEGLLWGAMPNGRYWKLRRNGATRVWKTRPNDFSIPVKAGLRSCARITEMSLVDLHGSSDWRQADFVVATTDPNDGAK